VLNEMLWYTKKNREKVVKAMSFVEKMDEIFQEKWKFDKGLPIQEKMIPEMIAGKDIVAESPTGTGKTLAYVIPLLHLVDGTKQQTQALIIAPSQELAIQITDVIRDWVSGTKITVAPLIGGANVKRQVERLKKKPTIVVGTPGRLLELVQSKKLKLFDIRHMVLDEGDLLLAREHRVLIKNMIDGANHDRQVVVVSATITEEIERVAEEFMDNPLRIQFGKKDMPKSGEVVQSFIKTPLRDKTDILRGLSHIDGIRALAFVSNVDQIRMKEMKLQYNKAPIIVLHANMRANDRQQALESFRKGEQRILIATDLAARGLDIDGLTHVIHVDIPRTVEQYLHRSGRTGRAGKPGEVLALLTASEERDYRKVTKGLTTVEKIWRNGALQTAGPNKERPKNKR